MAQLSKILFLCGFFALLQVELAWAQQCPHEPSEIALRYQALEKSNPALQIKHFNISGGSAIEVRDSLDKQGPIDVYGHRSDALTKWKISWDWPGAETGNPDFAKAKPSLDLSMNIPCWTDYVKADQKLQNRWVTFVMALIDHEKGHVDIARDHFERPAQAVHQAAAINPNLAAREANAIGENELEKIRQLDIKYDRVTEHGKQQGVKFP
jgi:predicted secreted Zn-dependent protease